MGSISGGVDDDGAVTMGERSGPPGWQYREECACRLLTRSSTPNWPVGQ